MIHFKEILLHNIFEYYFDAYQFITQNTVAASYCQGYFYVMVQFNYTKIAGKMLIFLASTNLFRGAESISEMQSSIGWTFLLPVVGWS